MSTIKTKATKESVTDFLNAVPNPIRKEDGFTLLKLYEQITGEPATMWGPTMIGFGQYHYKSERSRQEGDWPLAAFSPRSTSLTLYIMPGFKGFEGLLEKLGKHKKSVGCLYINKLADVDLEVLRAIIKKSYEDAKQKYT